MNTVNLIGNISTEVELRFTPNGKAIATFNLAVNNPYNREKTIFLPIEVWGKIGENTANFCSKGSKVGVTGHIDVDQWEKDGQKRSKTKIVASSIEFLTPKGNTSRNQQTSNTSQSQQNEDPFGVNIPDDDSLPF